MDIKPYIPFYDYPRKADDLDSDSNENREGAMKESDLNQEAAPCNDIQSADWIFEANQNNLKVRFTIRALKELEIIGKDNFENLKRAITEVLKNDPRSIYRRKQCSDRLYYFKFNKIHITCWFDEEEAEVLKVKEVSKQDIF